MTFQLFLYCYFGKATGFSSYINDEKANRADLYIFIPPRSFASQFYFNLITCSVLCAAIVQNTMLLSTCSRF